MEDKKTAKELYAKKPMSSEELAKKAGFVNAHTFEQFRKNPAAFPELKQKKRPDK